MGFAKDDPYEALGTPASAVYAASQSLFAAFLLAAAATHTRTTRAPAYRAYGPPAPPNPKNAAP